VTVHRAERPPSTLVRLKVQLRAADVAKMAGARLVLAQMERVLTLGDGDVDVYRPDGQPLVLVRRGAVSEADGEVAFPILSQLAQRYGSDNRGLYAGLPRASRVRADGAQSKQSRTVDEDGHLVRVESAVVGHMSRQGGRHPYCRATSFVRDEVARWHALHPLIEGVAASYRQAAPNRWTAQNAAMAKVHPAWRIGATPFTTLTVNRNVFGSIHRDAGDFKDGLGAITVHRRGAYSGAVLGFPQFAVGVDLADRDLVLFNPHDWHGVTDMADAAPDAVRVSVVYYMRAKMLDCGSPAEELARARRVKEQAHFGASGGDDVA
jgi:hypothetical protein